MKKPLRQGSDLSRSRFYGRLEHLLGGLPPFSQDASETGNLAHIVPGGNIPKHAPEMMGAGVLQDAFEPGKVALEAFVIFAIRETQTLNVACRPK